MAEVLTANCTSCHTDGGVAPFPLDSAEWAVRLAPAISRVVKEGSMPPWPPGPESPPFRDERTLSEEERSILIAWTEEGAPLGGPKNPSPSVQSRSEVAQRNPDRIITLDPPYNPDSSRSDDYRCFLLDPRLERDNFVTGYRVNPEQATLVHHSLLFVVGPEAVAEAETLDRSEPGPGWTCFGGPGLRDSIGAAGLLGFWVPGASGSDFPEGTGKLLETGSRIIMQLHYNLAGAQSNGTDASSLELFLADASTELTPIQELPLAAPVEILCPGAYPTDQADICNRDYALERSELRVLAEGIHIFCGTHPREYLARSGGDGSSQETSCDQQVFSDAMALGVTGHMHLRGQSVRVELQPGTPQSRVLLHIPDWDFDWQGMYWFQEPVPLERGDTVRLTCTYNNSEAVRGPDGSALPTPLYDLGGGYH